MLIKTFDIDDTTPDEASTAIGSVVRGLGGYERFTIDAVLEGATGGALDVYLQREVGVQSGVWRDWLHFPQLSAGAEPIFYTACAGVTTDIVQVGSDTTPALAADTFVGGHPGDAIRAVYVAGDSTSAGASVSIRITCWKPDR